MLRLGNTKFNSPNNVPSIIEYSMETLSVSLEALVSLLPFPVYYSYALCASEVQMVPQLMICLSLCPWEKKKLVPTSDSPLLTLML